MRTTTFGDDVETLVWFAGVFLVLMIVAAAGVWLWERCNQSVFRTPTIIMVHTETVHGSVVVALKINGVDVTPSERHTLEDGTVFRWWRYGPAAEFTCARRVDVINSQTSQIRINTTEYQIVHQTQGVNQ